MKRQWKARISLYPLNNLDKGLVVVPLTRLVLEKEVLPINDQERDIVEVSVAYGLFDWDEED